MIKIKSWFSKEIQDEYLDEMLLRIGIEEEANTFSDKNDKGNTAQLAQQPKT